MRPLTEAQMRQSFFDRLRPEAECLEWVGSRDSRGYGKVYVGNDQNVKAHRYAWHIAYGDIPAGMHILHRCDNPPCCNLEHLFLGTQADNMRDMASKGRQWLQREPERVPRGEDASQSRLTEAQARLAIASDESASSLAAALDVSVGAIYRVRSGATWRHIKEPRISGVERRRRRSAARRAEVERLLDAGHPRREIAAMLSLPMGTVHADCVRIRDGD